MGPGRMLKHLRVKHPGKLGLPSETEIRQRIASLATKCKNHRTIDLKRGAQELFKGALSNAVADSERRIKPE